jgi:hypothetical protein
MGLRRDTDSIMCSQGSVSRVGGEGLPGRGSAGTVSGLEGEFNFCCGGA